MESELNILISDRQIKLRDNNKITLRPCKVLQLRKILGLINKYVDQIAENEDAIALTKFLLQDSGEQGLNDVFTVLKSCSTIDKPDDISNEDFEKISNDEFFDNLYYDELALLVTKFLEMNKDFFASLGKTLNKVVNPDEQQLRTGESELAT